MYTCVDTCRRWESRGWRSATKSTYAFCVPPSSSAPSARGRFCHLRQSTSPARRRRLSHHALRCWLGLDAQKPPPLPPPGQRKGKVRYHSSYSSSPSALSYPVLFSFHLMHRSRLLEPAPSRSTLLFSYSLGAHPCAELASSLVSFLGRRLFASYAAPCPRSVVRLP